MLDKLSLLRSKQSEDVSAMSIVNNKNASAIEYAFNQLIGKFEELKTEFGQFRDKDAANLVILPVDFDIPESQEVDGFSAIIQYANIKGIRNTQLYITNLSERIFNFSQKAYQLTYDELVIATETIRLTENSATIIFKLPNSVIKPDLNLTLLIFS